MIDVSNRAKVAIVGLQSLSLTPSAQEARPLKERLHREEPDNPGDLPESAFRLVSDTRIALLESSFRHQTRWLLYKSHRVCVWKATYHILPPGPSTVCHSRRSRRTAGHWGGQDHFIFSSSFLASSFSRSSSIWTSSRCSFLARPVLLG